jgi:predicted nucleic acid-binding protein
MLDVPIARRAGSMVGQLRTKGITISIGDSIIASTALQLNVPLLTNNIEHYPYKGLNIVRGI